MRIVLIATCIAIAGCTTNSSLAQKDTNKNKEAVVQPDFTAGPPTLVYKTHKDYTNNVPVLLSEDKTRIVSYPDPKDLRKDAGYPVPTQLLDGYLLDNRGIGLHVAYLRMSYAEYAALDKAPSLQEMMQMIVDKDPLTELCNCGNRNTYTDVATQINNLIGSGSLRSKCKVVK